MRWACTSCAVLVARQGSSMTWAGPGRGLSNKAASPQRPSCLGCGSAACDARMCGEQCLGHFCRCLCVNSTAPACKAGALHSEALTRECSRTRTTAQCLWQGGCCRFCNTGGAGDAAVAVRSITRSCCSFGCCGARLRSCARSVHESGASAQLPTQPLAGSGTCRAAMASSVHAQ